MLGSPFVPQPEVPTREAQLSLKSDLNKKKEKEEGKTGEKKPTPKRRRGKNTGDAKQKKKNKKKHAVGKGRNKVEKKQEKKDGKGPGTKRGRKVDGAEELEVTPPSKKVPPKRTPEKEKKPKTGENSTFARRYRPKGENMGLFWDAAAHHFSKIIKPHMPAGKQAKWEAREGMFRPLLVFRVLFQFQL